MKKIPVGGLGLLALSSLVAVAGGCGSEEVLVPVGADTSAQDRFDQQMVEQFQAGMTQVFTAAALCQNDRSEACLTRAFSGEATVDPQGAGLVPYDDSLGPSSWLSDKIDEVKGYTKPRICSVVRFAQPYASRYGGDLRIYFVVGGALSGGAVGQTVGGAEAVWELNQHEASGYGYLGAGVGNSVGLAVSAYGGFGLSGLGGGLNDNWSGWFLSATVNVSFPGTRNGVGASGFRGFDPSDLRKSVNPLGVQGAVISASFGLDLANAFAATGVAAGTYYRVSDVLVTAMHGRGTLSVRRNGLLQFEPKYRVSAGTLQAVDILFYGGGVPQVSAAMIAYGTDLLRASGQGLVDWCNASVASNPCGDGNVETASLGTLACSPVQPPEDFVVADGCGDKDDGLYCSAIDSRSAFRCRGQSFAGAEFCPSGEHCLGTDVSGAIRCGDGDGGVQDGGSDADAGAGDAGDARLQ